MIFVKVLEFIGLMFVTFILNCFALASADYEEDGEKFTCTPTIWFLFTVILESVIVFVILNR